MAKLVALYKHAEDQEAFDHHYREVHIPLTHKMPGLTKVELTYFHSTPTGEKPPYYLQATLHFPNIDSLKSSMQSPEGKAAAKDLMRSAGKLVTMLISES